MSEVEDEIRRQMIAEMQAVGQINGQPPTADQSASSVHPQQGPETNGPAPAQPQTTPRRKGLLGALTAIGAAIAKFWGIVLALLGKLKFLLVIFKFGMFAKILVAGGSALISIWAWSAHFGWPFAIGFVLLIVIHECGHALAARLLGHPTGFMVFIPFCGGLVSTRGCRNVVEGAFIGIMGPVTGTLACLGCCGLYLLTGNSLFLGLAFMGFFINLINLAPAPPLDGGWLLQLFSPKLLLPCVVISLFLFFRNPVIWILILMSIPRLLYAWKHGNTSAYYQASSADRWKYGLAWAGLAAFLAVGMTVIPPMLVAIHQIIM